MKNTFSLKINSNNPVMYFLILLSFSGIFSENVTASSFGEDITQAPYNAVPNDGIDDTAAIEAAIEAATDTNGSKRVIIPAGVFEVHQTIQLVGTRYSHLTIAGIGRGGSTIKHIAADYAFHFGNGVNSCQYINIEDLRITGHANGSAGIFFDRCHRSIVRHVNINSYTSAAKEAAAIKYKNTWIHSVLESDLYYNYSGVTVVAGSVNALTLDAVTIEASTEYGVYLKTGNNFNIVNSTIEGTVLHTGVYCFDCRNLNVMNSYFEGIDGPAIELGNSANNHSVTIANNYIALGTTNAAIDIRNIRGASISGNTFIGEPTIDGSYISLGYAGYSLGLNIQYNTVKKAGGGAPTWGTYSYVKYIDPSTGLLPVQANRYFNTGFLYDVENKKYYFGNKETVADMLIKKTGAN